MEHAMPASGKRTEKKWKIIPFFQTTPSLKRYSKRNRPTAAITSVQKRHWKHRTSPEHMEHEQHRTTCRSFFHQHPLIPAVNTSHAFRQRRAQLTLWIPPVPTHKPAHRPRLTLPN